MHLNDLLENTSSLPLLVVDIQPAYSSHFTFDTFRFFHYIELYKKPILWMYNSDEDGMTEDSRNSMIEWFYEHELDISEKNNITLYSKGYGNFRDWMDHGIDRNIILTVIRKMIKDKAHDHRELFNQDEEQLIKYYDSLVGDIADAEYMASSSFHLCYFCIPTLTKYKKYNVCGGGRNECLEEVLLMLDALGIKYNLINEFVY
jgi:hypothetical protein